MKEIIDKSYELNFIMLVSITILVFIRSIQHNLTDKKRVSLQLSAFVTMIASLHYYLMVINKTNVNIYRYFDWFFYYFFFFQYFLSRHKINIILINYLYSFHILTE